MGYRPVNGGWQNWKAMELWLWLPPKAPTSGFPVWAQRNCFFSIFMESQRVIPTWLENTYINWVMNSYESWWKLQFPCFCGPLDTNPWILILTQEGVWEFCKILARYQRDDGNIGMRLSLCQRDGRGKGMQWAVWVSHSLEDWVCYLGTCSKSLYFPKNPCHLSTALWQEDNDNYWMLRSGCASYVVNGDWRV